MLYGFIVLPPRPPAPHTHRTKTRPRGHCVCGTATLGPSRAPPLPSASTSAACARASLSAHVSKQPLRSRASPPSTTHTPPTIHAHTVAARWGSHPPAAASAVRREGVALWHSSAVVHRQRGKSSAVRRQCPPNSMLCDGGRCPAQIRDPTQSAGPLTRFPPIDQTRPPSGTLARRARSAAMLRSSRQRPCSLRHHTTTDSQLCKRRAQRTSSIRARASQASPGRTKRFGILRSQISGGGRPARPIIPPLP